MEFFETGLKGAFIIKPQLMEDQRGFFGRIFSQDEFDQQGLQTIFKQANHSGSTQKGTIRGMHFQFSPYTEAKLVKCIRGKIYDVLIDLRKNSPTFLRWYGAELSDENKLMMYVPNGFAHGFQSLEDNSEIFYLVSEFYKKDYEGGAKFDDPIVGIKWPLPVTAISEKDKNCSFLDKNFKGIEV